MTADLDFEAAADLDGTETAPGTVADNMYEVTVTATDPSLAATMVYVRITVMDVNEAPTFDADSSPTVWTVNEEDGDASTDTEFAAKADPTGARADSDSMYAATDVDGITPADTAADTAKVPDVVTLTVDGPDKDAVGEGKAFTFTRTPGPGGDYTLAVGDATKIDYEGQKEYAITIVATDSNTAAPGRAAMTKSIDVKIEVNNLDEAGSVSLSQVQMQAGIPGDGNAERP